MKKILLVLLSLLLVAAACNKVAQQPAQDQAQNTTQQAEVSPTLTYKRADGDCAPSHKVFPSFTILRDGEQTAKLSGQNCNDYEIVFLDEKQNQGRFFTIPPSGVGGYIPYGVYTNLYYFDYQNNSVSTIVAGNHSLTNFSFNKDHTKVVYATNNAVIVEDVGSKQSEVFQPPVHSTKNVQFGDAKFSPDQKQVVVAAGYGPEKPHGEIYTLDLTTKKYTLYKSTEKIPHIDSWDDSGIHYHES